MLHDDPDCYGEPCGEIFILDWDTGDLLGSGSDSEWLFGNGSSEPPRRPVLANFDPGDSGREILVGAWVPRVSSDVTEYRVVPLRVVSGTPVTIEEIVSDVDVTITHRFGNNNVFNMETGSRVSGEAMVVDLDGGSDKEALVSTDFGELLGLAWDNGSPDSVRAVAGWPMLFEDLPYTPCFVSEDGRKGVLVSGAHKTLHFFEFQDGTSGVDDWPQYGHDNHNTGSHVPPIPFGPRPSTTDLISLRMTPTPLRDGQKIQFRVSEAGLTDLAVYDVSGRRVRVLLDQAELDQGIQSVTWDGRNDHGRTVAAGIYFYRLSRPDGSTAVEKTVVMR